MADESCATVSKRAWVGGNWKCNGTKDSLTALMEAFGSDSGVPSDVDVVIAPATIHIGLAQTGMRRDFQLAAQNIWTQPGSGAFTGEVSAAMVKDFGLGWVLVGHSERRHLMGETLDMTVEKVLAAFSVGLKVVLCIGETLAEREADKTMEVVIEQLGCVAKAIDEANWGSIVIAYEPVWAIGTGKVATPSQAQQVHAGIRQWLAETVSDSVASATRIVYGGSVKDSNCASLIAETDVDGFLVGGASLKPMFLDIIRSASGKFSGASA